MFVLERPQNISGWSLCVCRLMEAGGGGGEMLGWEKRVLNDLWRTRLSYYSAPLAPSSPPLFSARCLSVSVFLCVAGRAYWRERRQKKRKKEERKIVYFLNYSTSK
jgi:hypothetical protein